MDGGRIYWPTHGLVSLLVAQVVVLIIIVAVVAAVAAAVNFLQTIPRTRDRSEWPRRKARLVTESRGLGRMRKKRLSATSDKTMSHKRVIPINFPSTLSR